MLHLKIRTSLSPAALAILALVSSTCSSPAKPGPIVAELTVSSVTPGTGPAAGGTEVTIRGAGFGAGTTVTIGGRAATDVNVRGSDMITAKTPASTVAGAVYLAVSLNGRTGTLTGGFRYEVTTNTPPTIKSIVAQGKRPRQPANFGDYGETLTLTAVVEDAQANPATLNYQWQPCGGTIAGTGAQVEWTTPATGTIATTCTIQLIVGDGPRIVTGTLSVRLHNSSAEVANLAIEFLNEFADNSIPAELAVRNFSEASSDCRSGKTAELQDIQNVRQTRIINSHVYGATTTTINFGGVCAFRNRSADACIATPVEWQSTIIATKAPEIAKGISRITGVYETSNSRWQLCRSEMQDGITTSGLTFMH